jgi:hypothetical protein
MSTRTSRTLPIVEPIVPIIGSPPLHDPKWIYEPKFDGFRGVESRLRMKQRPGFGPWALLVPVSIRRPGSR